MIDLPSWYLPCAIALVAGVALGWVFGRGHTSLEKRYIRHLEWALAVTEGIVAGYRRAAARLASMMAGRTFAHSEHAIASAPVPAVYVPALERWGGPLAPDPQVYDHMLRTPASRVYTGLAAGIDDATRIVNDVLNDLGPPPGWRPTSLADLEPEPAPGADDGRAEHTAGGRPQPWYATARAQLAGWRKMRDDLVRRWRQWRAELAAQRKADRSNGWAEPGGIEVLQGIKPGRHATDAVAERQTSHVPRHVHVPPLTFPCPMPRSCTP